MTKYKYLHILFALAFVLASGSMVAAQDDSRSYKEILEESSDRNADASFDPMQGKQAEGYITKRNSSYTNGRYVKPTYENISKMYWAIYALKLTDDEAIDNYLRINECDIWEKYYHDDFQWEEIREATRKFIAKNRHTFPMKFEILLPLKLGRYNMDREVFEIKDITKFNNMKKMDITLAEEDYVCHSSQFFDGYPGTTILILDRPFHFVEVPVKPELAQLFIKEFEEKYSDMATDMRVFKYERDAFLRVLVSFNNYVNTSIGAGSIKKAVVHAKIDAVEVYADRQNTKPLYIKSLSEIRKRRKNRVIDDTTNNDIDQALQGLLSTEEDYESDDTLQ